LTEKHCRKVLLACPEEVSWATDTAGLILVHSARRETHILTGHDAAVWDLLTLGYSYPQLLSLAAGLLDEPELQAERKLWQLFDEWRSAGLLVSLEQADG
jgi:hypothetical protein